MTKNAMRLWGWLATGAMGCAAFPMVALAQCNYGTPVTIAAELIIPLDTVDAEAERLPAPGVKADIERGSLNVTETPRVTVLLYGQPVAGARVELFPPWTQTENRRIGDALVTDGRGTVTLPELKPWSLHRVVARWSPSMMGPVLEDWSENSDARGDLIAVEDLFSFPSYPEKRNHISLELNPNPEAMHEEAKLVAQELPITRTVSAFRGIVSDSGGKPVPGAAIGVERKGKLGWEPLLQIQADDIGHFSADLTDGYYAADFEARFHATMAMAFTVTHNAGQGEMSVVMEDHCPARFATTVQ